MLRGMRHTARCLIATLSVGPLLAACAHPRPDLHPDIDLPSAFVAASPAASPESAAREWLAAFGSAELLRLVETARSQNHDLAAAAARVRQADQHARAAGAALLPSVGLDASATHYRGHAGSMQASETDSSAGLTARYELDFWGANRSARDSAAFGARARRADRDALQLVTDASVAETYFLVLSLRERAASARTDVNATRRMFDAVDARFAAGTVGPQEVAAQRALVATAEVAARTLEQQEGEALVALALLVGIPPERFEVEAQGLEGIPAPALAPATPAELIVHRPDIAAAEYELSAAHADLLVARAAFFPAITLSTSGAIQKPGFNAAVTTLAGTGSSVTFAAALVQAIFDGGERRAARNEAQAREDELLANYQGAVQSALGDVETALSAIHMLDLQAAPLRESVMQSQAAFDGAEIRFRQGSADILSVLDAQRTLIAAHDRELVSRLARLDAVVSLAKALGGGWKS